MFYKGYNSTATTQDFILLVEKVQAQILKDFEKIATKYNSTARERIQKNMQRIQDYLNIITILKQNNAQRLQDV